MARRVGAVAAILAVLGAVAWQLGGSVADTAIADIEPQPAATETVEVDARPRPGAIPAAPPRPATEARAPDIKPPVQRPKRVPGELVATYGAENMTLPATIGRRLKMPVPDAVYALLDRKIAGAPHEELVALARELPGPMVLRLTTIEWLEAHKRRQPEVSE